MSSKLPQFKNQNLMKILPYKRKKRKKRKENTALHLIRRSNLDKSSREQTKGGKI